MLSLVLLFFAFTVIVLGHRLHHLDEVYAMALYSLGLLSGIWGFSLVPSTIQLTMGVLAIGCLQIESRQK